MHLLTLGLNHNTAPVEVRERLAFAEGDQPDTLRRLREQYGLAEAAILSTCNRSEIYGASEEAGFDGVQAYLSERHDAPQFAKGLHFGAVPAGHELLLVVPRGAKSLCAIGPEAIG